MSQGGWIAPLVALQEIVLAYAGSANVRHLAQPQLYRLIANYDPPPYSDSISVVSLALFGADDTNVPSAESVR